MSNQTQNTRFKNVDTKDGVRSMSAFAQSAYACATHGSAPEPQSFMGNLKSKVFKNRIAYKTQNADDDMQNTSHDYNLLHYPGSNVQGTIVDGLSNRPTAHIDNHNIQSDFQPLTGASIVLLMDTSNKETEANSNISEILEEKENIGCVIESLGAIWVPTLDAHSETITHAIWIGPENGEGINGNTVRKCVSNDALTKLSICQSMDIPVVNTNWLVQIHKLNPGQHWSEIDVDTYRPNVMDLLEKINKHARETTTWNSNSNHKRSYSRRDMLSKLSSSIGATYNSLLKENPDLLEADAIKRATELSMLDFAIVHHVPHQRYYTKVNHDNPYQVLRTRPDASHEVVKRAYRRRALETHPDKGGKPGEFEAVARAYRIILNTLSTANNLDIISNGDGPDKMISLNTVSNWDNSLKEHGSLVREMYANHGHDIDAHIKKQSLVLEKLGLRAKDAGSHGMNEKNEYISNSCFYLSLSCSYLSGIGAFEVWDNEIENIEVDPDIFMLQEADRNLILDTALSLKRIIESEVLANHPEWAAQGMVGEEVQAFSDFLVYSLESQTIVNDWAIVVFDTCSGFCDVYKGKGYAGSTITIQYLSGHYQPLITVSRQSSRPTLETILNALNEVGVLYVITDGAARLTQK